MARRPASALLEAALVFVAVASVLHDAAAASSSSRGPHMADLNVLLPPRMTNPVVYRLQGSDGCFSWSWDHHDILSVEPEYNVSNRCSTSARLISIGPYNGRKETSVYATDLVSGTTIHCKVFIDNISRIQIFHHAIKIDLDQLTTLHVRAFDEEENIFSSLVGLPFLWRLVPNSSETDNVHHLFHVPLKETPLSDCGGYCGDLDTRIELEDKGMGSDLYVVEGLEIGQEIVSVQLFEPQFEHVTDMIVLTVAEAMSLDPPSPVLVTVDTLINYTLKVIRLNTARVIDLPSQHHRWHVMNSSVAWVDSMMGVAHALMPGITDIVVEDIRVSGHVQTSCLRVVVPNKLSLYLVPVTNAFAPLEGIRAIPSSVMWYVFPGHEYIVLLKVFAEESDTYPIHITEKNDLKLGSNTFKYWDLSMVSDDVAVRYNWRNSRLLTPIYEGEGFLTASLTFQRSKSAPSEVLKLVQEVNVCSRVKLIIGEETETSKIILLPWLPGIFQELELKPYGGCGKTFEDYKWYSSDEGVVLVSASGIVRTKRPGQATVRVVSAFDPLNHDEVLIEVSVPSSMVVMPMFSTEVVVGTQLQAAARLKSSNGSYFTRCDAFNSFVQWKVLSENESFKIINSTVKLSSNEFRYPKDLNAPDSYPCAWTNLNASAAGRATLAATLSYEPQMFMEPFKGPMILKASSTISAYYALVVYQSLDGNKFGGYWVDLSTIRTGIQDMEKRGIEELYLVPGSTMDLLLFGGPEPWGHRVEYIETVDVLGESDSRVSNANIVQRISSGLYRVSCQILGKFILLFSRGNLGGNDHPMPATANAQVSVMCDFPSMITLVANEPENTLDVLAVARNADRGSGRLRISAVVVSNGRAIRLAAVGIHSSERFFANSSSLCLKWELHNCERVAYWNDTKDDETCDEPAWERFLFLQDSTGLCIIRATVVGFSRTVTRHLYDEAFPLLEGAENSLTDALQLHIVSSLRLLPESILLVFDPETKVNLSISGGTFFLDAFTNDTQVVQIIQHPGSMQSSHLVVGAKGLGVALVTIHDIGLSPPASASSLVRVANVDWIKIFAEEEISIMEGTTEDFEVLAGTQDGSIFDFSQYTYMGITVHLDNEILELVGGRYSSKSGDWVLNGAKFSVRAANLGITSLYVSARQSSGNRSSSQVIKVEVYKPLQVHPEYIYLMPGASYMLTVKGGPRIRASIEYTSMNGQVVTLHSSTGKLSANSVGNSTVRAIIFTNGGTSVCEAYGRVEVGIPSIMTLNFQSNRLCIGCRMPIFPSFPEGDLFSFYETCQGYGWMIENQKVLDIQALGSLQYNDDKEVSSYGKDYLFDSGNSSNDFGAVLIGRSAGKTKLFFSIICEFTSSDMSQPMLYNASESITVVPDPALALGIPITWVLPPFYTTSDLLPRTSEPFGQLGGDNRKSTTVYSLLSVCDTNDLKRDAITIAGSKIRTRESNYLACIQAKDRGTGRAEVASCLRVAEVAQVRLNAESSVRVAYLPVNAKLELTIKYCDDLGYVFNEAHGMVPMDIETNYPNIVSIFVPNENNSTLDVNEHVIIQARSPGTALVRIHINHNPKKADFILVSVGAQMFPRNPTLHVGHILNFTIVGDGMEEAHWGHWFSGNEGVLSVNRTTGEAHAHGEGIVEVTFNSSYLKLQTTVTVLKVNQIFVDAPEEILTNIPFLSEGYKFPVRFSDPTELKMKGTGNGIGAPYDCKAEPTFIGYAKPWSDHITRTSYCLFFPYSPRYLSNVVSKHSTLADKGISNGGLMHISIIASLREDPKVAGSANAVFVGGFSVLDPGKLSLTPNSNKSLITILGNTEVEVFWNANDLLLVSPLRVEYLGIAGRVDYQVEVLKRESFTDKITIALPSTGQKAEVDVSYDVGGEEKATESRLTIITWPVLIVCAIVLIVTVAVFLKLLDKPDRPVNHSQPVPAPLSAIGPVTPDQASISANVQSSPRTPQPFMEYVRRTIDDTPYYKRGPRRGYNPQYTY